MADDLPIKVTLDPAPAARGAQTLVREVAKVEDQAKKTTTSFAGLEKQLGNIEREASKAAKGVSSINFKQAASGAWQGFQRLNSELGLMDSNLGRVVGRTVEFGATGAQIAGPWGAAIGAVTGFTVTMIKNLTDAEAATRKLREEQEKLAKEYWDGVKAAEQKAKIEAELASTTAKLAEEAKLAAEREKTLREVMNASADAYRKATDRAMAYQDQLTKVNGALAIQIAMTSRLYGADPTASTPQSGDESTSVGAQRGLRDATIGAYAADKSYGATLVDLANAENKRTDRLRDLEQIMGDINVEAEVRNRAFKEYNETLKEGTKELDAQAKAAKELAEEMAKLRLAAQLHVTGISGAQFSAVRADIGEVERQIREEAGLRVFGAPTAGAFTPSSDLSLSVADATKLHEAQQEAARFQQTIDELNKNTLASLQQMAQLVGDTLVDAFTSGEFAADKFFASLGSMAAKGLINNLIGFGFAQLAPSPVPGFASGGYIPPGGTGGTDSQLVAIRKSPWESVHINTPSQEAAMMGGGGRTRTIILDMPGGGQARFVTEGDFEELHLRSTERNSSAIRSRLTGR
ncbi:MAG: hypothetical protein AB7T06_38725 [Kofleriaceae bacterium]